MSYILAIDQGTTSSRAVIFNQKGIIVGQASQEFPQVFPKPGWVEHDPEDIWNSVVTVMSGAVKDAKIKSSEISAIGITNQRETCIVWDKKSGKAIHNAIVWQDRRTADLCQKLKKKGLEKKFKEITGLVLDPYFSGTKIAWILDHVPQARKKAQNGGLCFGTIDSFLLWRLSGGATHSTDVTNASRTLMMDLKKLSWDPWLCKVLKVEMSLLPEIKPSIGEFGKTSKLSGFPDGIPITGIAGDQQAALFGQGCFDVGEAKCTFGTGSFLLLNTGSKIVRSQSGLLTTVAWRWKTKTIYAIEGSAFICGAAVQWLRDGLGLIGTSSEIEGLAAQAADCGGVQFVPALAGLAAPHWAPGARGVIDGLTRGSTKAHLARATLEGMAMQNVELLLAMEKDLKKKLKLLKVDGGASKNNLLMQMQADFLGVKCARPQIIETTAAGAAFMAGLGAGIWTSLDELRQIQIKDREFLPKFTLAERRERLDRWKNAVNKA